jgi:tRNA nucleotidyltransferase (CCA-adding enzyme)
MNVRAVHIEHKQIRDFAVERVNVKRDDLTEYRAQANRLRDKLEKHISEHSDYGLVKMRSTGSVAKGTALKTINDMDLAVLVESSEAPKLESELLSWMADRLREAYPNHPSEQIKPGLHAVTISFSGSGLDVDVAPVLWEGEADDVGYLIVPGSGQRVRTSVTQHLKFLRTRKDAAPFDFAQVVRLLKWWVRRRKTLDQNFRFKSFMVELVCAYLADTGTDFSDYPGAMEAFFAYIVQSELTERIAFDDFYADTELPMPTSDEIEIFDPVNPDNNVAALYTYEQRRRIVEAADEAVSAITEAVYATTKGRAVDCWQIILGPTFKG